MDEHHQAAARLVHRALGPRLASVEQLHGDGQVAPGLVQLVADRGVERGERREPARRPVEEAQLAIGPHHPAPDVGGPLEDAVGRADRSVHPTGQRVVDPAHTAGARPQGVEHPVGDRLVHAGDRRGHPVHDAHRQGRQPTDVVSRGVAQPACSRRGARRGRRCDACARSSSGPRARCSTMRANMSPTMARATAGDRSASSGIVATSERSEACSSMATRSAEVSRAIGSPRRLSPISRRHTISSCVASRHNQPISCRSRSARRPAGQRGRPLGAEPLGEAALLDDGPEEVGLRREVVVERGHVELAGAGQAAHRGAGHAPARSSGRARRRGCGPRRRRGGAHGAAAAITRSGVKTARRW